jgi:hypothetical protein
MAEKKVPKTKNYDTIIEHIFFKHYAPGATEIAWARTDIPEAADAQEVPRPGNYGDVVYHYRYRGSFPESIQDKAPEGTHWIIRADGRARYKFCAVTAAARVTPTPNLAVTKVPDATPEIIRANALGDEQALLALVRYNRLIDIFLGVAAYSLQNHLRTTAPNMGQVEVDEVYVAVDRHGVQYVLPVQAKGGSDEIGITQTEQDIEVCKAKFAELVCRPVAAQFMSSVIALFELAVQDDEIVVVREAHYELVPFDEITPEDRKLFRSRAGLPPERPTSSP